MCSTNGTSTQRAGSRRLRSVQGAISPSCTGCSSDVTPAMGRTVCRQDFRGRIARALPIVALVVLHGTTARAQVSYRNLDAGLPVRIEDATVTDRYDLDLDLLNLRYDELSGLRNRFQYEPRASYGVLPRTEMWLRAPLYYRERTISPRKGIAGVGVGGMYQVTQETLGIPAVAIASEAFIPTGPGALPPAYSVKALVTRTLSAARIHFNARVASYTFRRVAINSCQPLPGGTVCSDSSAGPEVTLPPLDGPCRIAPQSAIPASYACAASTPTASEGALAVPGRSVTHAAWMIGVAVDKTLPLRSVLFVADLFAERFEGI